MKGLFWISFWVIFYAYIGYPILLVILTLFKRNEVVNNTDFTPLVSFIIAVHNEEKTIRAKIEQSLNLNYPREKLEILVASDASVDRTDDIVRGFCRQRVVLIKQGQRRGKTAAQNLAVQHAKGEILVFSDATTILNKDAIKNLIQHFKNPNVGCVAGKEQFLKSADKISQEASFFWNYELFLRKKESKLNSLIGVSGCIFAIRKKLYKPLNDDLIEDLALPLEVTSKGYKVLYDEKAIGYEDAAEDTKTEFMRKARIVTGGINVLYSMKYLLNPFRYPILSFQLISHKIFRWLAPLFMILLLLSNIFLLSEGNIFLTFGIMQVSFYILAFAGYFLQIRKKLPKFLKIICHFCIINFSAIIGIIKFFKGERKVIWEPTR